MPNDVHLSKTLSWILRHGADRCGLSIDANGYVSIEALLQTEQLRKTKCTRIDIERIVSTNDKQRFAISSDGAMIRANQGHSMQCVKQCDLQLITDPKLFDVVVHGTNRDSWRRIEIEGLSRMTRNHIHFASGLPGDCNVISGMRSNCNVLIYIDLRAAIDDGYRFFLSENNVILCAGNADGILPTKYFKNVQLL